jgi:hypothetical protein
MNNGLGLWAPLSVGEVARLFADAPFPWWIAGGWAIDLFVGHQTRMHSDTDVLVLRRDQLAVQAALPGWDLHAADPPGTLRRWQRAEKLPQAVHDIWCRPGMDNPWVLQLMLAESDSERQRWIFRRDARIRRSVSRLGLRTPNGVPYVAPEVQLLYKAKARRPKDEQDFESSRHLLAPAARTWLRSRLDSWEPGNPWVARIDDP